MRRIITPLEQMGAEIIANNDKPPLTIIGSNSLKAINYKMNVASAQLQTSILLAAFYADGSTQVTTPTIIRDHTQRMLTQFGCKLQTHNNSIVLYEQQQLTATDISIPVDFSSVCFFIVATLITEKSEIILTNVGVNPGRTGALKILLQMGADITCINIREISGEPVADIIVRSSQLLGINVDSKYVASSIDEWPILLVAAACASGITTLHGAKELRYKETDRITAMATGLKKLGVMVTEYDDGITLEGIGNNNKFNYANVAIDSYNDHRIAMAFIIAGLIANTPVTVTNCQAIATSSPNFIADAKKIGIYTWQLEM
jgi:3-phosphoshikimate 1-carboxyvinyltransferase